LSGRAFAALVRAAVFHRPGRAHFIKNKKTSKGELLKHSTRLALLFFLLLAPALSARAQAAPEATLRGVVSAACKSAGRSPALAPALCGLGGVERRHVSGDIFEYSFRLKVGEGEHDRITVHRVVREKRPGVPRKTDRAVLMLHGDLWGFDGAFLGSTLTGSVPREQSIAAFMAGKDVDVWGVDLRWTHVPADTTDFTFMKDWDTGTHVRDLGVALGVARAVRVFTGSGAGRLALMGWSRGGIVAYAYAGEETRLPEHLRHVGALIPVDIALKLGAQHEEQRAAACVRYAANKQLLDAGQYHSPQGVAVQTIGLLASTDAGGPSPLPGFGGLTNAQAALLVGSATHVLFGAYPPVPAYHFNAGEFDASGLPAGLQFTREAYLYDFFKAANPFQSFTEQVESEAVLCGDDQLADLPYDDRLGEINVPVLYVGAAGGFGEFGLDTLPLLGSADVSSHVVRLRPAEARAVDFGHADIFMADDAKELVWQPVYEWLSTR
jgi:pimeloyl-ACP methyl ester carboxylesterase